jgi:oligoribonuclease
MRSSKYLVWLDLEMTGLDSSSDVILEIATVITTSQLEVVAEGPVFAIHQSEELLSLMDAWNVRQHTASGLIEKVRQSIISVQEAQKRTLDFLTLWCAPQTAPLCGNTIYQDRSFLRSYMPDLNSFFHYRIIDVSSIKELVARWYPENPQVFYKKPEVHRALDDVYASINELQHYRTHFFMAAPFKE